MKVSSCYLATRAVEILGHNLGVLVDEIRKGQLNSVHELATAKAGLKQASGDTDPVIMSVRTYPDFEEILKEIKGEEERETRHAKRIER